MLCKNEPGEPYFLLHFLNISNMITKCMKFEKNFFTCSFKGESP